MTSEASFEEIIYDIESDGLLPELVDPPYGMTTIHCMVILDIPTEEIISFVRDDLLPLSDEDTADLAEAGITEVFPLTKGVSILENAKLRAGHKINTFDEKAIALIYPDYNPKGALRDTLVMVRMTHADIKEKDFRTIARGKLEGKFLGKQGLEAWGQRLGMHKGDYKKDREESLKRIHKEQGKPDPTQAELHNYVWGTWNPAMHIYMVQDARVNLEVYNMVEKFNWSNEAIQLEHGIDALMGQQEQNGFAVDVEHFEKLAAHLREEYSDYSSKAVEHIGKWFRPKKLSKKDIYNPAFGETRERRVWGLVTEPKRSAKMSKSLYECKKSGDFTKLRASTVQGAAFVATEVKEFNPNSRPQIIDRLQTLYGWEPQDFTEKGSPIVDDDVLRNLSKEIPLAETLAEIFFLKKRLGQIADGKNGWLKLVRKDGRIHGSVNVGGTVSGRATHANPNASQVPGVNAIEVKDHDKGAAIVEDLRSKTFLGRPALVKAKWNPNKGEWSIVSRGREGGYGWDCREGFVTTPGYKLVGCDLSGVEFRCLSNLTFPYDDGELVDIVLNGDIHQRNADLGGISRSIAKRALYACVDMDTMALTKGGWKRYKDLRVGDMVMTYNMEKDVKEWKPIQHLHFVPSAKRVRIVGRGIDVVCTPDHRWATIRRSKNKKMSWEVFEYCRTDELTKAHRIIGNAPFIGDTESLCLTVPFSASKYDTNWTESVLNMSDEMRAAWLLGFLVADGHQRLRTPTDWGFTQKHGDHFDAALAAIYLQTERRISTHTMPGDVAKTEICETRSWGCQKLKIEHLEDGPVWCMTTENGSFVMRRNDFVTITGNCMYGGGDAKLGYIIAPTASEARQKVLGADLRKKLMQAMPSLAKAIKEIKREKRQNSNTIRGLDGRRLYVRSDHSALNLRLQSDGALIAKKWNLLIDDEFYARGWDHHVEGEYHFVNWSHDETEVCVREGLEHEAAKIMEDMAPVAGEYFNFKCPIAAEAKIGVTWAEVH